MNGSIIWTTRYTATVNRSWISCCRSWKWR